MQILDAGILLDHIAKVRLWDKAREFAVLVTVFNGKNIETFFQGREQGKHLHYWHFYSTLNWMSNS